MIVIPMAGLSRRFSEAGYTRPKYMLQLNGCSVFAHAVRSFLADFHRESFLFVMREEGGTPSFVEAELQRLGVRSYRSIVLEGPTLGQADTVRLGLERAGVVPSAPLTIFNIDTFRPGYLAPDEQWAASADGWLEVMPSSDPGLSFARPSSEGGDRVAETAEKRVISELASTGVYGFRTASLFLEALSRSPIVSGEMYVAPLYNELIRRGFDIRFRRIELAEIVFCGTPAEYQSLGGAPA